MSSSIPLTSFNTLLHIPWHHKRTPSLFNINNYHLVSSKSTSSHICFAFNKSNSEEREESRWLREEQRWLREEQRWIREERRWESERQSLLSQIHELKLQIEDLKNVGASNDSVGKLLRVLKKEVGQIADTGSSASPLVVETAAIEEVVRIVDEVKAEEVQEINKQEVIINNNKKWTMLRVGSEGDQVQMLQEALLKLGFYCGEEDEEFSSFASGTERAVKTWQSSVGVPETGVMTAELLERLFMEQQDKTSSSMEGANGTAATSVTKAPEIPSSFVKEDPEPYESDNRVYLLGENRWEDASRLKNRNGQNQTQTDSKGVVTTKCITCRGVGHLLCLECDGTGEPNIEPQFLEWVGEDTKCPYCEGHGHITCDVCEGTGVGSAA
uniref:protein disulfide isomerase pTAC5, chloroplastic-like n=1 Tax=Erigeron canadensis TaxID=72917 RepID=UPI001CB9B8BD|nr:protein disulfide isomerase pTAC5, chloroplastic-like [Erigeron canadensis]